MNEELVFIKYEDKNVVSFVKEIKLYDIMNKIHLRVPMIRSYVFAKYYKYSGSDIELTKYLEYNNIPYRLTDSDDAIKRSINESRPGMIYDIFIYSRLFYALNKEILDKRAYYLIIQCVCKNNNRILRIEDPYSDSTNSPMLIKNKDDFESQLYMLYNSIDILNSLSRAFGDEDAFKDKSCIIGFETINKLQEFIEFISISFSKRDLNNITLDNIKEQAMLFSGQTDDTLPIDKFSIEED